MTTIQSLGELHGDVVLFGGIYSNAQALERLLDVAQQQGIPASNCIFTGDVVAYGGDPLICAERLAAWGCPAILGNCEQQLLDGASDCGCGFEDGSACDLASKSWYTFAAQQIGTRAREFWSTTPDWLVFTHLGKRYAVIHGGARDVAQFLWPDDRTQVFAEQIALIEAQTGSVDAVIAGHCGIPFERSIHGKAWINAGVIGMPPHDGRPQTRYAVLSADGPRFHPLEYDFEQAAASMARAGLTLGYDTALSTGIWPSEDVLPQSLRQ
ncbi:metallophosphoesterase family protein [uncultured Litoreibacter sp.]|uniref:metallophosphoesterase family protein n=1 Tax=uncultured Litoreibacter sp. TaxID=1392394 RepID=UPI002614682D|nr:metallophosphoesterase family protein [uncultured Litoreibacter sp.]